MLNEKRVKLMVKLASYETKNGDKDVTVSSYLKKDNVKLNELLTFIWTTLGYILTVVILAMTYMGSIMENLTTVTLVLLFATVIGIYIVLLITYEVHTRRGFQKKYVTAKKNVKKFLRNLEILEKMYEREDV